MRLKLDIKTLFVGIIFGIIIAMAAGFNGSSADSADFGFAIQAKGSAIVKTSSNELYIIIPENAMATRVLYSNIGSDPDDSRNTKARPFLLTSPRPLNEDSEQKETGRSKKIR